MSTFGTGMQDQEGARGRAARPQLNTIIAITLLSLCSLGTPARAWFADFAPPERPAEPQSGAAPAADPAGPKAPTVRAVRLDSDRAIRLDGKLDDLAWNVAEPASGFKMWDPERGADGYQKTVFKVAYDTDAIYFGVACAEPDPNLITKKLARRDRPTDSDVVRVCIDPYHDYSTGYYFEVNPLGVQTDGFLYGDGNEDQDWDAVWQAQTHQDQDGWYAELRIPLSSIRYRADTPSWGLNVFRDIHAKGETDAWTVWDRKTAGFVSRFGQVTGIGDIPAPRQIELLPYAVYRATDSAVIGPEKIERFQNFGLDLKSGITSELALNATFQPDFGQVEADPAVLNLSPFETFFQEKRPFFTEGSRYYQNPSFNQFYSRRIGTGDANSRIRAAAKLTGKTKDGISIGALAASTDITLPGQTHNFLKGGTRQSSYFVGRVGKEYGNGNYGFNVMQTAVVRPGGRDRYGDIGSREAYTTGGDFDLHMLDRRYGIAGSFVGSVIAPEALAANPSVRHKKIYGTGGDLQVRRDGGSVLASIDGRWVSDRLNLNDIGYLRSPDHVSLSAWTGYIYAPKGKKGIFNRAQLNENLNLGWMYAGRTGYDIHTGGRVWSYNRGHQEISSANVNWWGQLRNFWQVGGGVSYQFEGGTQRYDTENTVVLLDGSAARIPGGGALISEPDTYTGWANVSTDSRKNFVYSMSYNYSFDTTRNLYRSIDVGMNWNQSSAFRHEIELNYQTRTDNTQHIANYESPDGGGIGGVSYVYGIIGQKTLDLTLRTSLLFSRDQSLEIYAQPYLANGSYRTPRRLVRADTYQLEPFAMDGFDVKDSDFRYASVNLNAIYRWEYRPGSTLFLVWTHSRSRYDQRGFATDPAAFGNGLTSAALFKDEPENVFLAKLSYWFPL